MGLKNIQANDIIAGMRCHQPIQILLQKAKTIIGNTEYLVQESIGTVLINIQLKL